MKKLGKTLLWIFLTPVLLVAIFLIGLKISYPWLLAEDQATSSDQRYTVGNICVGVGCREQPRTLEAFVPVFAAQVADIVNRARAVWPDTAFSADQVIYLADKAQKHAWTVRGDGTWEMTKPADVPHLRRLDGRDDEFVFAEDPATDRTMWMTIDEELLRNLKAHEFYGYLGTYPPALYWSHEGFHNWQQRGAAWETFISNRRRGDKLDEVEARLLRVAMLDALYKAIGDPDVQETELARAVSFQRQFVSRFPESARDANYFDRIEGTAQYFEYVTGIGAGDSSVTTRAEREAALRVFYANKTTSGVTGAVDEAYALGSAAGILLDFITEDPMQWKRELLDNPEATPMSLLVKVAGADEGEERPEAEIDAGLKERTIAELENPGPPRWRKIFRLIHDVVFLR